MDMIDSLILFDWDGTLGDTHDLCRIELRETFRRMGLPQLSDETYDLCNGPTIQASASMMGIPPERAQEYVELRKAIELQLLPQVLVLFPGVGDMLQDLSRRGVPMAIISNGQACYIDASVDQTDCRKYFVKVQAYEPGLTKPENLARLLADMQPRRAILAGDRAGDIEAGRINRLPTIAARYGCGSREELAPADYQADDVPQLHRILLSWLDETALH